MAEGEYYGAKEGEGRSQRTRELAAYEGLLFVPLPSLFQREKSAYVCAHLSDIRARERVYMRVRLVYVAIKHNYTKAYACMRYPSEYSPTRYMYVCTHAFTTRARTHARTRRQNQLFDLERRGENNPGSYDGL